MIASPGERHSTGSDRRRYGRRRRPVVHDPERLLVGHYVEPDFASYAGRRSPRGWPWERRVDSLLAISVLQRDRDGSELPRLYGQICLGYATVPATS